MVSHINFDIWIWWGRGRYEYRMKRVIPLNYAPSGIELCRPLAIFHGIFIAPKSKYQSWYLTPCCGLEASLQHGVTYQFWYLDLVGEGEIWISHEILPKHGKVLSNLGVSSKVLTGPLNGLSDWVGFSTTNPQQDVKYQLWYLDLWSYIFRLPKSKYQSWYLKPFCGFEVQDPTQSLKSVKGIGNTFGDPAPQIHRRVSNINFDIWIWGV
jgi:hypothetical protein